MFLVAGLGLYAEDDDSFTVAVVDIQELFRSYHKTQLAEREINIERAKIQKENHEAMNQIAQAKDEVRALQSLAGVDSTEQKELENKRRELPVMIQEIQMKDRERIQAMEAANNRLDTQMMRRMNALLKEIRELTARKAEEAGYDLVIDSSGKTSNQAPAVPYIRDACDFTPMMKKELSKLARPRR